MGSGNNGAKKMVGNVSLRTSVNGAPVSKTVKETLALLEEHGDKIKIVGCDNMARTQLKKNGIIF